MKKRTWIIGTLAVVTVVGVGAALKNRKDPLAITYREVRVGRSDLNVTILSTGVVQPENRLEIKPPIAGRAETVLVKEGQKVRKGQVLGWMSSTERAALLDAARAKGPEEVQRWEELYRPTPIVAPIDGTIISRKVEPGQTFTNAEAVLVMSDRLTIKAQVDETDISQVKLRQKARIVMDAYPGHTISAHVDQIAFEAKTVNNVTTYEVDVLPEETPEFLRSGMTANVTFLIESRQNVLTVPNDALKVRNDQRFVLLKQAGAENSAQTPVETGLTDGKNTEITQGLNEGDTLLVAELKTGGKPAGGASNPFMPMAPRRGGGGGR